MNTVILKIILLGETGWQLRNVISQNSGRRIKADILYEDDCIVCMQLTSEYEIKIDRFARKVFNRIAYPTNNYWTINMIENPIRGGWDPTVMDDYRIIEKDEMEVETEIDDLKEYTVVSEKKDEDTMVIERPDFNKTIDLKTIKSSRKNDVIRKFSSRKDVYSEPGWKFL